MLCGGKLNREHYEKKLKMRVFDQIRSKSVHRTIMAVILFWCLLSVTVTAQLHHSTVPHHSLLSSAASASQSQPSSTLPKSSLPSSSLSSSHHSSAGQFHHSPISSSSSSSHRFPPPLLSHSSASRHMPSHFSSPPHPVSSFSQPEGIPSTFVSPKGTSNLNDGNVAHVQPSSILAAADSGNVMSSSDIDHSSRAQPSPPQPPLPVFIETTSGIEAKPKSTIETISHSHSLPHSIVNDDRHSRSSSSSSLLSQPDNDLKKPLSTDTGIEANSNSSNKNNQDDNNNETGEHNKNSHKSNNNKQTVNEHESETSRIHSPPVIFAPAVEIKEDHSEMFHNNGEEDELLSHESKSNDTVDIMSETMVTVAPMDVSTPEIVNNTEMPELSMTTLPPELLAGRVGESDNIGDDVSTNETPMTTTVSSSSLSGLDLELACETNSNCPESSECINNVCRCKEGHCSHNSTCLITNVSEVVCLCQTGFSGTRCEHRDQPCGIYICMNGAVCDPTTTSCHCPTGKFSRFSPFPSFNEFCVFF